MVDAQRTRERLEGERDRLLEVRRGLEADGLDERDLGGEPSSLDQLQPGHSEYLPTDDEPDVLELGPEEQALHATYLGTARSETMTPGDVELAEMQAAEARSDERFEAVRDEDARRAGVEAAVVEEEGLGEASSTRRPVSWRRLVRRRERRGGAEGG